MPLIILWCLDLIEAAALPGSDWSCCPAWIWLKVMKSIPEIRPLSPIYISVSVIICSQKIRNCRVVIVLISKGIHRCGDMTQQKIRNARSGTLHFYRVEGKWFLGFLLVKKKISSKSQSHPDPIMFGVIYKLLLVYIFWQYNCCYPVQ